MGPVVLLGFVLVSAFPTTATGQETEPKAGPSLYDRLGGIYAIAAVVDDLIERLGSNDGLNANPGIAAARKPERFPGLKYQLTTIVCQATGGPCSYAGESMKDAHGDMGITGKDWGLMEADFRATLDKFGVPEAEQQELFAIIGSTKGDIVVVE